MAYWQAFFSAEQIETIKHAQVYFDSYDRVPFGTSYRYAPEHAWLILVAKMAELLNAYGPLSPTEHTAKMKALLQESTHGS